MDGEGAAGDGGTACAGPPARAPSEAQAPLTQADLERDARSHLTAVRNYLHVAALRLPRLGALGTEDVAGPLHEALRGLDGLQALLDEAREAARPDAGSRRLAPDALDRSSQEAATGAASK